MKKWMIVISCLFLLTGCGQEKIQKEQLEVAGRAYYNAYGKQYAVDEYRVTLGQLKQAEKELKQDYDLSKLATCKDDTEVIFGLKDKKIKEVEIKLNCK